MSVRAQCNAPCVLLAGFVAVALASACSTEAGRDDVRSSPPEGEEAPSPTDDEVRGEDEGQSEPRGEGGDAPDGPTTAKPNPAGIGGPTTAAPDPGGTGGSTTAEPDPTSGGAAGAVGFDADNVVSFEDEHPVSGGSVEGNPGTGWDYCHTRLPGLDGRREGGDAAHGGGYLWFDSDAECGPCTPDGSDTQVMFSLDQPLPVARQGVWFDVRVDEATPQVGTLTFVDIGLLCGTLAVLAVVDLASLASAGEWRTHCIDVEPSTAVEALGVYAVGDEFEFALDALRVGHPCEAE